MNLTRDRLRSLAWGAALFVCAMLTVAVMLKVNAVMSDLHRTERQIAALKQEKKFLETEFQTRANQQQLKSLNDVEFGYQAPSAGQYLESERQLAALGKPRGPGAPEMIRVASAAGVIEEESIFPAMVSPLTGKAIAAEAGAAAPRKPVSAATLRDRLSTVEHTDTSEGASRE